MEICKSITNELMEFLSSEFDCSIIDNIIVINTPFLYSDGDYIQLFIQQFEKLLVFSDMGETARRMDAYSFNWNSSQVKKLYKQILKSNNIESQSHILRFSTATLDNMGPRIFDLIRAIQQKDNLLILKKPFKQKNFKDQVESFLLEEGFKPETDFRIDGDSGNEYQVDFYLNHNSNILIKALSSHNDTGDKDQISRTYTSYSDIKIKHKELKRAVVLDDIETAWDQNQKKLINQIVDIPIAYWSKKDDFKKELSELMV